MNYQCHYGPIYWFPKWYAIHRGPTKFLWIDFDSEMTRRCQWLHLMDNNVIVLQRNKVIRTVESLLPVQIPFRFDLEVKNNTAKRWHLGIWVLRSDYIFCLLAHVWCVCVRHKIGNDFFARYLSTLQCAVLVWECDKRTWKANGII